MTPLKKQCGERQGCGAHRSGCVVVSCRKKKKITVFNHTAHKSFFQCGEFNGTLFIIARTLIADCGRASDVPDVGLLFTNLPFDSRQLLHLQKNTGPGVPGAFV